MGTTQQELEASVKWFVELAYESPKADELTSDLDYGRAVVLAAPKLLAMCERLVRAIEGDDDLGVYADARELIAKARKDGG